MNKYKNFKNLLDNPSIFDDIDYLKNEIMDCFIDEEGHSIIGGYIDINNEDYNISFYDSDNYDKLFSYNKQTKKISFPDYINNNNKNSIIELFNKTNNE